MNEISILGIYVADLVFLGDQIPIKGETVLGNDHLIGPGGKGSNQAVAVAKAGGKVNFISKIGADSYGEIALQMYKENNMIVDNIIITKEHGTGVAGIFVNKQTGENAITVVPGASGKITKEDINQATDSIKKSKIFLTQLETPIEVVEYALSIASSNNITTILNPAPATKIGKEIFHMIDYFTPNETEASFYVGYNVDTQEDVKKAANQLMDKGIRNVIITLGEKGVYFANNKENFFMNAFDFKGKVIDTTGAGDGFNAGLAVALAEEKKISEALQFANALAGLSTTKLGTAKSMPTRIEIDNLMGIL